MIKGEYCVRYGGARERVEIDIRNTLCPVGASSLTKKPRYVQKGSNKLAYKCIPDKVESNDLFIPKVSKMYISKELIALFLLRMWLKMLIALASLL